MSGGTVGTAPGSSFEAAPLAWIDAAVTSGQAVKWAAPNLLCVFGVDVARGLLKNDDGFLIQHSDFFGAMEGALSPRAGQVAFSRDCHALVQRYLRGIDCTALIEPLGRSSYWPAAGNRLMLEMMRPLLASPDRSPAIHAALDLIVEKRIANRHRPQLRGWTQIFRRFQLARAILMEAGASRPINDSPDMLDIVGRARGGMSDEALVHLYLGLVFALVGSIGFALGWALLLAVRHDRTDSPTPDIVREALRLYPIAWLLGRTPAREGEILGERVSPSDVVAISPYGVHRDPVFWPEPDAFQPERWQGRIERWAWLPFGVGGQSCVAASLSVEIAGRVLEAILGGSVSIEGGDGPPCVRAALTAPSFKLHREAGPLGH